MYTSQSKVKNYKIVLPTVQAPFKIRPIEQQDVPHCIRLLTHVMSYHNYMDIEMRSGEKHVEKYFKVTFERCLKDKLTFVVVNENEPIVNDEEITAALKDPLSLDHSVCIDGYDEAASLKKLSRHYAGCILAYDCGVPFPFEKLPSEWEYFALYSTLFRDDFRKEPTHPFHKYYVCEQEVLEERKKVLGWKEGDACLMDMYVNDDRVHIYEMGVSPLYFRQGLGRKLAEAVRDTAFASDFHSIEVAAIHEGEAAIFQSFGALEVCRGYPGKVSKIVDGQETSRWKNLTRSFPYMHIVKDYVPTSN